MSGSYTEEDLLVTVSFHNIPATLITEFIKKIVKPYYNGTFNEALKNLMEVSLIEEEIFQAHLDKRKYRSQKRSEGEASI